MDFWKTEERLWREGAAAYEELLTGDGIMVFGPVGILERDRIVESIRAAPRWSAIEMSDQIVREHGGQVVILAYRARVDREGGGAYEAYCTSTYIREGDVWRIAQHQQSPIQG